METRGSRSDSGNVLLENVLTAHSKTYCRFGQQHLACCLGMVCSRQSLVHYVTCASANSPYRSPYVLSSRAPTRRSDSGRFRKRMGRLGTEAMKYVLLSLLNMRTYEQDDDRNVRHEQSLSILTTTTMLCMSLEWTAHRRSTYSNTPCLHRQFELFGDIQAGP
jgi:hypothetical protein